MVLRFAIAQYMNFNPRSDERSDSFGLYSLPIRLHFNPRSDERSDAYRDRLLFCFR